MTSIAITHATIYDGSASNPYLANILLEDSTITACTTESIHADTMIDAQQAPVVPGYIDIHHHGGAGGAYDDGSAAARKSLDAHYAHGTTRSLLSLVTGSVPTMAQRIAELNPLVDDDPRVLGLHLEGPFLHPDFKGAHPETLLRDPQLDALGTLIDAADGRVRQVTLAPERAGADAAIAWLMERGIHVAVGHTSATFEQANTAFAAGADILTHAFNGMQGIHHRAPGPVIAALRDPRVWLEIINDGIHVHPAVVRSLFLEAPERVVLVTDAMAAACNPDGDYMLGELAVAVENGVARLKEGGSLAGSTLTMDRAVARAVHEEGMPLEVAVAAATTHPAAAIGLADRFGQIAPGYPADILILDPTSLLPRTIIGPAGRIDFPEATA
ncbi:MAG: N-acetylglucosamine-6-phosphate deacetylase [Corynebacterium sp.]|nr:N-acetylglucosamine-6-phosphate deacetylase [Corynebacterium sp.]